MNNPYALPLLITTIVVVVLITILLTRPPRNALTWSFVVYAASIAA